jgi:O-antigen/teichoic acid export membrane protein
MLLIALPPRLIYWIKVLSRFISIQIVVQALSFASGMLLIRSLSKEEYAYFTIANSMQATMNMLADSGISSALSAIGGRVWQDPYRFGQLINTAMQWRRYLAMISVALVSPILIFVLLQNNASINYAILLTVGILTELYFYLNIGILASVIRFHRQIDRIQVLDILSASSRIFFLLGGYITLLNAAVGVFASTISSGLTNLLLGRYVKDTVDIKAPTNSEYQGEIIKLVKTQAPTTIFYCVQGQLTVWLISIFGNTQNIAEVGALSRLGVIFSLFNPVIVNIVVPSFARCQSPKLLLKRYLQIITFYVFFSLTIITISIIIREKIIILLGNKYVNLLNELILMIFSTNLSFLVGLLWSLNLSKGWIQKAWLYIPTTIITQILLLLFLDISTVKGVIVFGIMSTIPSLIVNLYMNFKGLININYE